MTRHGRSWHPVWRGNPLFHGDRKVTMTARRRPSLPNDRRWSEGEVDLLTAELLLPRFSVRHDNVMRRRN